MTHLARKLALGCVLIILPVAGVSIFLPVTASSGELIKYPEKIEKSCRAGLAKIYDECSDQTALFQAALARANAEGKTLLISYGAEWCIWCHVFDAYIQGEKSEFEYSYASPEEPDEFYETTLFEREENDVSQQAQELRDFVAANLVVAHIENYHAPGGYEVLELTKAAAEYNGGLPFIFTVDSTGNYYTTFDYQKAETRRDGWDWYRGYDRQKLLAELKRMNLN